MALMSSACLHERNRTASIPNHAAKHGYAVGAFNCFNDDGVMAVIQAAERMRSPAIVKVFPWTLHFQGIHFIRWIVDYAHNASVPFAVHLDHCIKDQDVQVALELPFDSIMVDASTQEGEENLEYCKLIVGQDRERGIAIEAERWVGFREVRMV
ncbi:hypothetical protein B9Z65_6803 [Elsinoe australis]|uniref:Fructose-bisphosphate aldolase n=1 Tax=Elsinoe australis TaxID=40998 RepID=A0A2P7Z3R3_9PEZI|nr:hypothetical protein B9Z65_6803 [Elsinoe australis]